MTPLGSRQLLSGLLLLLTGALAHGDAITGQVVGPTGVPVAGVDIDFVSLGGGGNPHEMNDGTDASGFFTTTVDPGIYEIRFYPPSPPSSTLLTRSLPSVVVVGTVNLGTITLDQGVSLGGTLLGLSSIPVAGVKVSVLDQAGSPVLLKNNTSNAFGLFNVAVPQGQPLTVQLNTSAVFGQTLAPQELALNLSGNTNLGNHTLLQGFHVTGVARRSTGTLINGADVDITDPLTGATLYTPSDNTNILGTFDVVVPAGTYDLDLCPPAGFVLVGADINNLVVTANTNVGDLILENGVVLSGVVRTKQGFPVAAADVNVVDAFTGESIALCSDNTTAAGTYSVIVPVGTFHVTFSPPGPHLYRDKDLHYSVEIAGSMTLNGTLFRHQNVRETPAPPQSGGSVLLPFSALPGSHGVPAIDWRGGLATAGGQLGEQRVSLALSGGAPGQPAMILLGLEHAPFPGLDSVHRVLPAARLQTTLSESGTATLSLPPLGSALAGRSIFAQLVVVDPATPRGYSASQVLRVDVR